MSDIETTTQETEAQETATAAEGNDAPAGAEVEASGSTEASEPVAPSADSEGGETD